MTTAETVLLIAALLLIVLVIGNVVFSKVAERRNPPVGKFTECDGVRLWQLCTEVPKLADDGLKDIFEPETLKLLEAMDEYRDSDR